jgi:TonB family protein
VDAAGKVVSVEIVKVSGHPTFGGSVQQTLPSWRFPPPRIRGKPRKIRYLYRVNFALE